jgi:hypothetical protein
VGPINVRGANGVSSSSNDGGAGSGGVVLLRAGGAVTVTTGIDVSGGTGPNIAGATGRVRIDAPGTIAATVVPSAGGPYRGPTFPVTTPLIVRSARPTLSVVGQPNKTLSYYINNEDGSDTRPPVTELIPSGGTKMITLNHPLFEGLNELCVIVEGASTGTDTRNCIEIVYLYAP